MATKHRPWRRPLLQALTRVAPLLLRPLLALLYVSLRIEVSGDGPVRAAWARGEQVLFAFWHNRLLLLPWLGMQAPLCIMISQHRDGDLGTRLLAPWDVSTVRGSATRGGVSGYLRLVAAFRHGRNLAVLPDGPRGPRYVAKPGVVHLARTLDAPIVPVAYAASRGRRLRSWDRLLIPLPFARVRVELGEALHVPPTATGEELDVLRAELEQRLCRLTAAVEARGGGPRTADPDAPWLASPDAPQSGRRESA